MKLTTDLAVWLAMLLRGLLGVLTVLIFDIRPPLAVAIVVGAVVIPIVGDLLKSAVSTGDSHE